MCNFINMKKGTLDHRGLKKKVSLSWLRQEKIQDGGKSREKLFRNKNDKKTDTKTEDPILLYYLPVLYAREAFGLSR